MKAFFDVIVIGPGVAGRVAAALLARDGYRLLVLDGPLGSGGGGPATGVVTGLDSPVAASLFGTLGVDGAVRRLLRPRAAAWQIAAPRLRIDVPPDNDALERELAREAPALAAAAMGFFARIAELRTSLDAALAPGTSLWPRGLLERARSGLRRGRGVEAITGGAGALLAGDEGEGVRDAAITSLLRAVALAPAPFLARVLPPDGDEPPALAVVRALDALRRTSAAVEGGAPAVGAVLTEAAARLGAEVRRGTPATPLEIVHRRATAEGVRTVASGDVLGASIVLAACELGTIQALCPGRATHGRVRRARAAMAPVRRVLALPVAIPPVAVPPGMGPLVFAVADPDAPLEGANCLRIERTTSGLLVSCVAPEALGADEAGRAALAAQVLEALDGPCPFVGRHARDVGGLMETSQVVMRAAAPLVLGAVGPAPDTGLDNVWALGPEMAPGLDLEGELLAGAAIAARVVERLGAREGARGLGGAIRITKA